MIADQVTDEKRVGAAVCRRSTLSAMPWSRSDWDAGDHRHTAGGRVPAALPCPARLSRGGLAFRDESPPSLVPPAGDQAQRTEGEQRHCPRLGNRRGTADHEQKRS